VNSDTVVKSLVAKGLIAELGRSEAPGRPILYGVTTDFLQSFGLTSLDELPPIDMGSVEATHGTGEEKELKVLKD
jgi:segregation and condensation protein B